MVPYSLEKHEESSGTFAAAFWGWTKQNGIWISRLVPTKTAILHQLEAKSGILLPLQALSRTLFLLQTDAIRLQGFKRGLKGKLGSGIWANFHWKNWI